MPRIHLSLLPAALLASPPSLPTTPMVWTFENDALGAVKPACEGWSFPSDQGVKVHITAEGAHRGRHCAVLTAGIDRIRDAKGDILVNDAGFFLLRRLDATPYRGRRVRFSAWLKPEAPAYGPMGSGHLLCMVQTKDGRSLASKDPLQDPHCASTWARRETTLLVARDADTLLVGVNLLNGYGRLRVDDLRLEALP